MSRLLAEQQFHDRQAAERADSFRSGAAHLRFDVDAYLDHETWVRLAFAALDDLRGKAALDYGCGHGMAAVAMARAGASVSAFDLSLGYVNEARQRAAANGVTVECVTANGEELPFADRAEASGDPDFVHVPVDRITSKAYAEERRAGLDLARAGRELKRVLRPGGVAVFCEPWGGNPLLGLARSWLPYPGKHRTADERPLVRHDLSPLRAVFPKFELQGFQLFGMVRRVWPKTRALSVLDAIDARLLRAAPSLKNWCRYVVIVLRAE